MTAWPLKTLDGVMTLDVDAKTIHCAGQGGSLEGATASVDTAGNLDKKITATRLVLTGVFALAWQKKKDNRELYIMVDGPTYSMVMRIDPARSADARKFAAGVNTAARGGTVNGFAMGRDSAQAATKARTESNRAAQKAKRAAEGRSTTLPIEIFEMVFGFAVFAAIIWLVVWLIFFR